MRHFTEEDPKIQERHDQRFGKLSEISDRLFVLSGIATVTAVMSVVSFAYVIFKDFF